MEYPEYKPPVNKLRQKTKEFDEEGNPIHWSKSLSIYKKNDANKEWIYSYIEKEDTNIAVIIYDRYPKATIHMLLLPYVDIDKPSSFTKEHLNILRGYHNIARNITEYLSKKYSLNFKIGYHYKPSMDDLHIHIISDDISPSEIKSFSDKTEFLPIDFIESELETHDNLRHLY